MFKLQECSAVQDGAKKRDWRQRRRARERERGGTSEKTYQHKVKGRRNIPREMEWEELRTMKRKQRVGGGRNRRG